MYGLILNRGLAEPMYSPWCPNCGEFDRPWESRAVAIMALHNHIEGHVLAINFAETLETFEKGWVHG